MGISGLWGSYLTESAERKHDLDELSKSTLTDLHNSRIGKASRFAAVVVSLVDGISPIPGCPAGAAAFFFHSLFSSIQVVYFVSLGSGAGDPVRIGHFPGKDLQRKT